MPYAIAMALEDVHDPDVRAFAESIGRQGTNRDIAARILRAVSDRIRYEPDTKTTDDEPTERIRAPHRTLRRGAGDCDCMAGLIFCLALILGLEPRIAVVASSDPEQPHHAWAEAITETGWTAIDPVLRPPELGRRLDGRIILWDSTGREVPQMYAPIVIPRRTAPIVRLGLGAGVDTSGVEQSVRDLWNNQSGENVSRTINEVRNAVESAGQDWTSIAKNALTSGIRTALNTVGLGFLADLIDPIWNWLSNALSVTVYPHDDFIRWAEQQTGVTGDKIAYEATGPKGGPWDLVVQSMMTKAPGYFPIYLHDKDANAIAAELDAFGWPPRAVWSHTYGEWYTPSKTRSGILLVADDMRAGSESLKLAASRWRAPDDRTALAASQEKAKALLEKISAPVNSPVTFAIGSSLWPGATGGVFPPMPGSTAPEWLTRKLGEALPPAPAPQSLQVPRPMTTTTTQTTPPPGAVLVRPPTTGTTAPRTTTATTPTPPPGAVQVRPPTAAAPAAPALTTGEASVLAAIRQRSAQQQGIDIARRSAAAARAFLGLGDVPADFTPTTTAAELSTRAHQLVYSANPENNRPAGEVQTRALVFQRGAGLPETGDFDAATREEAARIVGDWVRSVPLRTFREMLPSSTAAAAAATAPQPTTTGLPAASLPAAASSTVPPIVTVTPVPGTPVLVSPAPSSAPSRSEGTHPLVYAAIGYAAAKALEQ